MAKEPLYDYAKGLNAPYWIQEIKTKNGTRVWYFATPMQLSFFIVFLLVFIVLLFGAAPLMVPLARLTHSISLLLFWFIPYKLAKYYTEYEPQGKQMHVFIVDYVRFFWDFKVNKKSIYHNRRFEKHKLLVFEKTKL